MNKSRYNVYLSYLLLSSPLLGLIIFTILGSEILKIHIVLAMLITIAPVIFIAVFIFHLFLYLRKRKRFYLILLISVVILTIIKYGDEIISFNYKKNDSTTNLKVLTWNLQRLGNNRSSNIKIVAERVKQNELDVLIIQEVTNNQLSSLAKELGIKQESYKWIDYYGTGRSASGGLAILLINNSKWKLKSKKTLSLPPQWKYVYVEIQNELKQKINILGVHIAPPKITTRDFEEIIRVSVKNQKLGFNRIKQKLRNYSNQIEIQNKQIDKVLNLLGDFHDPTIIAGDFNSTPELPTHIALRKKLTDAWLESGNGLGSTRYWGGVIPLRIDYIYSANELKPNNSKTLPPYFSDHNALFAEFSLY